MKNTKKQNVVLLIVYIVLSVVLFASLFFVAGAVFEWDFVLQLEKLIVKSNYDFDILVWGYWIAGISAVVLVAILMIEDEVEKRKSYKKVKHQYKF